jgi:hypothetical protein
MVESYPALMLWNKYTALWRFTLRARERSMPT